MIDLYNKILLYYNSITNQILHMEFVEVMKGFNEEESLLLFNLNQNIKDNSTKIAFLDQEDYPDLFIDNLTSIIEYSPELKKLIIHYEMQEGGGVSSERFYWNNHNPQRQYSQEEVLNIYYNDYYFLIYIAQLLPLFDTKGKLVNVERFPKLSTANSARFCAENEEILHQKGQSCTLSYTLSFTGKRQYIKRLSWIGVGNVGYFHKTFFREKKAETLADYLRSCIPEGQGGSGNQKHRTSLPQTSVLLR